VSIDDDHIERRSGLSSAWHARQSASNEEENQTSEITHGLPLAKFRFPMIACPSDLQGNFDQNLAALRSRRKPA